LLPPRIFKRGKTNDLASGNLSMLAPTICRFSASNPSQKCDAEFCPKSWGNNSCDPYRNNPKPRESKLQNISDRERCGNGFKISRVRSTIYLDEGNGAFVAIEASS